MPSRSVDSNAPVLSGVHSWGGVPGSNDLRKSGLGWRHKVQWMAPRSRQGSFWGVGPRFTQ